MLALFTCSPTYFLQIRVQFFSYTIVHYGTKKLPAIPIAPQKFESTFSLYMH